MQKKHLKYLRCPKTGSELELIIAEEEKGRIKSGTLKALEGGAEYPLIDFIPRFVDESNYANNFGDQWNRYARTQYDSESGFPLSETRFFEETKFPRALPENEVILECGSGSGRFTEWALSTGAMVVSFDFSSAVSANYKSNGQADNLLLVQASVYDMPFEKASFEKVVCIGVVQHTPEPKKTFMNLAEMIKPGGTITTDIYPRTLRTILDTRHLFRLVTTRMEPQNLHRFVTSYVNTMWPLVKLLRKIPFQLGVAVSRKILCIADHGTMGLKGAPEEQLKTWAILNSYDIMGAAYENSQTMETYRRWHEEAGLEAIDVHPGYNGYEGRGRKPEVSENKQKKAA